MLRVAPPTWLCCLTLASSACGVGASGAGNTPLEGSGGLGTAGSALKPMSGAAGQAGGAGGRLGQGGVAPAPAGGGVTLGGAAAGGAASATGAIAGSGGLGGSAGSTGGVPPSDVSLLIFSRTAEYRHDSIPAGIEGLGKLAGEHGWQFAATEDASTFTDNGLAPYNAVIFLSTTGDVLDDAQQAAFERFIRAGHGFVGIHAASDTEYDWSWYGALVGAFFREHPAVQAADVLVEDLASPATAGLPKPWHRTDEWYAFRENPRQNVHVLLTLDEASYTPAAANMNGDHPIAWSHEYDGGRAFYTALGHTSESYSDPIFMGHVAGGIAWVLGLR